MSVLLYRGVIGPPGSVAFPARAPQCRCAAFSTWRQAARVMLRGSLRHKRAANTSIQRDKAPEERRSNNPLADPGSAFHAINRRNARPAAAETTEYAARFRRAGYR